MQLLDGPRVILCRDGLAKGGTNANEIGRQHGYENLGIIAAVEEDRLFSPTKTDNRTDLFKPGDILGSKHPGKSEQTTADGDALFHQGSRCIV